MRAGRRHEPWSGRDSTFPISHRGTDSTSTPSSRSIIDLRQFRERCRMYNGRFDPSTTRLLGGSPPARPPSGVGGGTSRIGGDREGVGTIRRRTHDERQAAGAVHTAANS